MIWIALAGLLVGIIRLLIEWRNSKRTLSAKERTRLGRIMGKCQTVLQYGESLGVSTIAYDPAAPDEPETSPVQYSSSAGQTLDREGFRSELIGLLTKAAGSMFVSASQKTIIKAALPVLQKDNEDVNACLDMMLATLPASSWREMFSE